MLQPEVMIEHLMKGGELEAQVQAMYQNCN